MIPRSVKNIKLSAIDFIDGPLVFYIYKESYAEKYYKENFYPYSYDGKYAVVYLDA